MKHEKVIARRVAVDARSRVASPEPSSGLILIYQRLGLLATRSVSRVELLTQHHVEVW